MSLLAALGLGSYARAAGMPAPAPSSTDVLDRAPKLALAIGINTYSRGWPNKQNAVTDAKAVAGELMRSGYKVAVLENPDARTLARALKQFLLVDGDRTDARLVVWFSGQSHTLAGRSFLVPSDAPLPNREMDFKAAAVSLEDYTDLLRRSSAAQIYTVIDAPVAATDFIGRISSDRDPSTSPYLPVRQFLSSAAVGQAAADDSLFRRTFLRALAGINNADTNKDKLLTADEIGPYIQGRVGALTKNHQTPLYGRLGGREYGQGDYAFVLGPSYRGDARNIPRASDPGDAREMEEMVWNTVQKSNDPRRLELFLKLYPDGAHAEQAFAQLSTLNSPVATAAVRLPIADDERAVPAPPPPARVPTPPPVTSMELVAPPKPQPQAAEALPPPASTPEPAPQLKVAALESAPAVAPAAPLPVIEPPPEAVAPPMVLESKVAPAPPPVEAVIPTPRNFLPSSVSAAIVPVPPPALPPAAKPASSNPFDKDSVASELPILASSETFDGEMAVPADNAAAPPGPLPEPDAEPQSMIIPMPETKPVVIPAMIAVGPAGPASRVASAKFTTSTSTTSSRQIQLGAYKTRELAERNLNVWRTQFPNLFDGSNEPIISLADLGEKGTYYRVRVGGFDDLRKAADFCSVFRGGPRDCYIVPEH